MNMKLPHNAHISEINGPFYYANLQFVPRVGDLIDLYSFLEQADNRPPVRHYEVVQVIHKIHDVSDKGGQEHKGAQFVTVLVKPSESPLFGE